jgi:hypothetical protein
MANGLSTGEQPPEAESEEQALKLEDKDSQLTESQSSMEISEGDKEAGRDDSTSLPTWHAPC